MTLRVVILAAALVAFLSACSGPPGSPAPTPGQAVAVTAPATRGAVTVWARQVNFRHAVLIKRLTVFKSYFDVIQPGEHSPARWDVEYRLRLSRSPTGKDTAATVAIWVSSHNRVPARKVAARPWFDGRQWLLWVGPDGALTFTQAYTATGTGGAGVYSTRALVRRWYRGWLDELDMTSWLKRNGYLPDNMRLAGQDFGWTYTPPPRPDIALHRWTLDKAP